MRKVWVPTETVVSDAIPSQAHQLLLNWVRVHLHHVQTVVSQLKIEFLAHNSPFLPPGFSNLSVVANPESGRAEPQRIITLKPDAAFDRDRQAQGQADAGAVAR